MPAIDSDVSRYTLRALESAEDHAACIRLQRRTWGQNFNDLVPATLLRITLGLGGVVAGAFDENGELVAFVYGLTGVTDGELCHWSHLLAVAPELRNSGLGLRLKLLQRELLLPLGIQRVRWTFDPLVARNAHLNLNRLGAGVAAYHRDYYGDGSDSSQSAGIGTDRFVAAWAIASEPVARILSAGPLELPVAVASSPVVNTVWRDGRPWPELPPAGGTAPDGLWIRIEIPRDIHAEVAADPGSGPAWRASTRGAFETYLGRGYRVAGLYRDPATTPGGVDRVYYALCSPSND